MYYLKKRRIGLNWTIRGYVSMTKQLEGITSLRFLSLREVISKTGIKKSAIYYKLNPEHPRYDSTFPKRVKVGTTSKKFIESEVDAWMAIQVQASRPIKPDNGDLSEVPQQVVVPIPTAETEELAKAKESSSSDLATIRQLLEQNARKGKCLSYEQAMAPIRLWADVHEDRVVFEKLLEQVSRESHATNKGLLSVLIHERVGSAGRPSAAFFKLVKKLGYSYEDEDVFVDHEIKRLYLLREDPQSLHKNRKLMWVETRSGRILTRL